MANKLGAKYWIFYVLTMKKNSMMIFMKMISMNSVKENCSGKHAGKKKSVMKKHKAYSTFREENDAYFNDEAAAPKARTGTATRSSGSKVVRMPSSNSELEVCIVKPSNIGEAQQVCDTLLNDHPVVVNLEGIDLMEAQRIMDFISGCILRFPAICARYLVLSLSFHRMV